MLEKSINEIEHNDEAKYELLVENKVNEKKKNN